MAELDAKAFKELWDTWNIRGLIIVSLLLQSFLILFAPLRRQIGDKWIFRFPLWIAYLLADWIAIFVMGLILHADRSHDTLVLWAPFLLLHLGGPDTITSFSLEDNEFWIRHLLQLILQVGSTVHVIIQSLPHNKLLLPTLLVLTAGIFKYAERNRAFYIACLEHYGEARLSSLKEFYFKANMNNDSESLLAELTPYGTFRNLVLGPLIPPKRRDFCRRYFLNKRPEVVLEMIEFELSLLYEILHTKFPVVSSKIGHILRIICMGCITGALLSFRLITRAKQYRDELENTEVWVTYGLLIGAITLEFISIGLLISSDFFNTDRLGAIHQDGTIEKWIRKRVNNRRMWSKRIPQLDFITYCVKACPDWLHKLDKFLPRRFILEFIQGFRSMSSQVLEERVWDYIFEQVREKAESADTIEKGKEICLRRGDGILSRHSKKNLISSVREFCLRRGNGILNSHSNKNLIWSVRELDYVESLLTWHLATELCFEDEDHRPTSSCQKTDYRKISKLLSNYMFYLLHEETVIGSKIDRIRVFDDTYKHMQSFYLKWDKKAVLKRMISANPANEPKDLPRSVLCKAKKLFNELKGSDQGIPWELMSKVWVELMCYAAINCRPHVHAQQPSKGGQLITIVWLLMNHFGLGTQFATIDDDEEKSADSMS